MKENRKELLLFNPTLAGLKYENGNRTGDRVGIENVWRDFCTNFFASKVPVEEPSLANDDSEHFSIPVIEVHSAAVQTKNGKAPGLDEINNDIIKAGKHEPWKELRPDSVDISGK